MASGAGRDRWLVRSIAMTALVLLVSGWQAPIERSAPADRVATAATATRRGGARAARGWITVVSARVGAHIRVAGRDVGETPIVRYALAPGRYVVEAIQRDGSRRLQRVHVVPDRGALVSFE